MKEETFTFPKHHLELLFKINSSNNETDFIEITVKNLNFNQSRLKVLKLFLISILIYLTTLFLLKSHTPIHIVFFLFTIGCFFMLANIVEKEDVKVLKNFGLQYSTQYAFSQKKSSFIPCNNIYNIVINEVIYLNQIIFVLQILTDKEFYQQTPIVVLFDNLLPPVDCLKKVYNQISTMCR